MSTTRNLLLAGTRAVAPVASAIAPKFAAQWYANLFVTPLRHARPAREHRWLSGARRNWVRSDAGHDIPLYLFGDGPTVLLVHGWAGRGSQLGAFIQPLVERGYRVVAFDAPAHGDADGRQSSLPELATAIARVVRNVGPVHAIVAHSLGTAATSLALSRGVTADRLVYVSPADDHRATMARLAGMLGFSPDVAARAQRNLEQRFGVPFEAARNSTLAPHMSTPLLIVHDEHDAEVPWAEGEHVATRWPGARLVTTRGLGHRRILRDADVVSAAVDFVATTDDQQSLPLPGEVRWGVRAAS